MKKLCWIILVFGISFAFNSCYLLPFNTIKDVKYNIDSLSCKFIIVKQDTTRFNKILTYYSIVSDSIGRKFFVIEDGRARSTVGSVKEVSIGDTISLSIKLTDKERFIPRYKEDTIRIVAGILRAPGFIYDGCAYEIYQTFQLCLHSYSPLL